MTLREYAKLMNDTALQGSLSNEEYNRLYKPLLDGIQSMILVLKESVINIECCQRCFQLV